MIGEIKEQSITKEDLIQFLASTGEEEQELFQYSGMLKQRHLGNEVFLRGIIELSNICEKNCYYCGIRRSNRNIDRYNLSHQEVMELIKVAHNSGYGSVAIQTGEMSSKAFTLRIDKILNEAKQITNNELGITLSCGEQSEETYRRWFESGADRYLLRIETSSEKLYKKLHPNDGLHSYSKRINALKALKKINYQVGTGVMIGMPFQTLEILADDLLFMKNIDIDMCGMGPYIEHIDTPLFKFRDQLLPPSKRFNLGLKMISLLRILMPDINIAATTAMQTIEEGGREKAILVGANIIMPNITPEKYRKDYLLYENKPISLFNDEDELNLLNRRLSEIGHKISYYQQGNSKRYAMRNQ